MVCVYVCVCLGAMVMLADRCGPPPTPPRADTCKTRHGMALIRLIDTSVVEPGRGKTMRSYVGFGARAGRQNNKEALAFIVRNRPDHHVMYRPAHRGCVCVYHHGSYRGPPLFFFMLTVSPYAERQRYSMCGRRFRMSSAATVPSRSLLKWYRMSDIRGFSAIVHVMMISSSSWISLATMGNVVDQWRLTSCGKQMNTGRS
mmetsp:Transcript_10734/g.26009  ORF Transcript_10734/g.26009 Transcript_10734/m.26009 type:complete len:201 (+) Transcript_10734:303-905(+)